MSRFSVALFTLAACATSLGVSYVPAGATPATTAARALNVVLGDGNDDQDRGDDERHVRGKDAGSIDGEVVGVDYRTGRFTVRSDKNTYDIVVLPSTDFQGRTNSFHGFADIKRGARVRVMLSQRANTYTAQIIHLR